MSLQVWLPFNGNLNNQGLSEVTVTNSGATVASNGKIGSCYLFNPAKLSLTPSFLTSFYGDFSFSLWLKVNSFTTSWETYLQIGIGTAPWNSYRIGLLRDAGTSNLIFCIGDGNSSTQNNCQTSYSAGDWYHFTCTYSKTEQKMRIYKNGVLSNTHSTSIIPKFSDVPYITLGQVNDGTYKTNCLMNDFRLYNHCLSAKEVKEISKGVICHYKLDNKGFGNPNLLVTQSPSDFSRQGNRYTSTIADTRTNNRLELQYFTRSGYDSGFYSGDVSNVPCDVKIKFTVPENIVGIRVKFNGASRDIDLFNSSTAPVTPGETYTFSLKVLSSKSEVVGGVQVENPKLEKGSVATSWCPHTSDSMYTSLGLDSTMESDCSGLSNNGTKIGGLSSSTNPLSIRYESCYDFDGSTGSIQIPNLSTLVPSGEFTMNCWIYHDNTWSSKGYETIFGGPSGFELEAKNTSTNAPVLHAWSWGKGTATYELNKWNMITMTRNASETKFYINGELKITGSAGTIPSGNYFIGAWNTSSQQNYKGKISDFRLYSTVLSTEDIKTLYNTSASVDKNGNMYAYEFKEE